MEEYMVAWETGQMPLKTRMAAIILKDSFLDEGREARAYERMSPSSDWKEMV